MCYVIISYFTFICFFMVGEKAGGMSVPQHMNRGQRITCVSWFSPSTMDSPGIDFRSSDSGASTLICSNVIQGQSYLCYDSVKLTLQINTRNLYIHIVLRTLS